MSLGISPFQESVIWNVEGEGISKYNSFFCGALKEKGSIYGKWISIRGFNYAGDGWHI